MTTQNNNATGRMETTPGGVPYAIKGDTPGKPAPTLLVFAAGMMQTLDNEEYNRIGSLLMPHGYVCVALDVPCHGDDIRADEGEGGIPGWGRRVLADEALFGPLTAQVTAVLDHLIATGVADPAHLVAVGTSRGGFTALHVAAGEPRLRRIVAFAPVTDVRALREFGMDQQDHRVGAINLDLQADNLADRAIWMCIGNNDQRVDTDRVIGFTRRVVSAADARGLAAQVELHVMTTPGHSTHATAHDEAAAWVLAGTEEQALGGPLP